MKSRIAFCPVWLPGLLGWSVLASVAAAQSVDEPFFAEELFAIPDSSLGISAPLDAYEVLNAALGGDSLRMCDGQPCQGPVEDRYANEVLKHRGHYQDGHLLVYRNYWPNAALEREYQVSSNTRSSLATYHPNGQPRSITVYVKGEQRSYSEHYVNGQLRYAEEKHTDLPVYTRMDLFAPDGRPISTLELVDKKRVVMAQKEYWPNGQVRCEGRSQYDRQQGDTRRIGEWVYNDEQGQPLRKESYLGGKVHLVAEVR
jgi:antitoxin component YwqK of YwqJK toxin-antitoxin module